MKVTFSLYYTLLFMVLLVIPLSSHALSSIELHQLRENPKISYIYCGKNYSKIAEVIATISELDQDKNSPVWELNRHINNGFSIGKEDAVLQALEHAEIILQEDCIRLTSEQVEHMQSMVNSVLDAITHGQLTVNLDCLLDTRKRNADNENDQNIRNQTKCILRLREKLYALESAKFFKNVEFKEDVVFEDDARIHGKLKVYGKTTFENDVLINNDLTINGNVTVNGMAITNASFINATVDNLSATDAVIGTLDVGCDLTVGCNISMNDSISPSVGNIVKNGIPFIHNFGMGNTFVGINAGNFTMTGVSNTAIGAAAFTSNTTGNYNTATGGGALIANTIGIGNVAYGVASLLANVSGNINTAFGFTSLLSNVSGSNNTALGSLTLGSNINGSSNTAVGHEALGANSTGSGNIALGFNAGNALMSGDNNIYIAHDGVVSESGTMRIGTLGTHTKAFVQGIFGSTVGGSGLAVEVDVNGQLGTIVSSNEFKKDIANMDMDSANLYKLNPVKFVYKNDTTNAQQYGLIAEEVEKAFPELVVYDREGKPYSVRYQVLPVLLLNEVQKQQASIEALTERVALLEAQAPAA